MSKRFNKLQNTQKIRQKFSDACQLDCDAQTRLTNDGILRYLVVVRIVAANSGSLSMSFSHFSVKIPKFLLPL